MTPAEWAEAIARCLADHQRGAVSGVVTVRVEFKAGRIVRTRVTPPEIEIEPKRAEAV